MDIAVLGIDLGKTVCSLSGLDRSGSVVFRQRIQRYRLLDFLAELPTCVNSNGGLRRRASHRLVLSSARPRTSADVSTLRPPLREGSQER